MIMLQDCRNDGSEPIERSLDYGIKVPLTYRYATGIRDLYLGVSTKRDDRDPRGGDTAGRPSNLEGADDSVLCHGLIPKR